MKWPWRKKENLCCLIKQKEAATQNKEQLEIEIENMLYSEHPKYAAYIDLINDITENKRWRYFKAPYLSEKLRDREDWVICIESEILNELESLKRDYKRRAIAAECER